jgi:hypothetical protein
VRFEDRAVVAGVAYGYRVARVDAGEEVFAGEVWARAEAPRFSLEPPRPHPARASRLRVGFSVRSDEPATVELLDVGGRRIVSRSVGALGAGSHEIDLAEGQRLRPGVYLVKLSAGAESRVMRVVVLD